MPHSMCMPASNLLTERAWHGHMVLPPADAVLVEDGGTFDKVRQRMTEESLNREGRADALAVGCTGDAVARQLEEASCAEGSTYCWHRCMEHADHGVSVASCSMHELGVQCVNPREQFSNDNSHGDFFLYEGGCRGGQC